MAREVRIAGQEPDDWSESTRAEFADVDEASRRRLHLPSVIAAPPDVPAALHDLGQGGRVARRARPARQRAARAPHRLPLRIRVRVGSARADRAVRRRVERSTRSRESRSAPTPTDGRRVTAPCCAPPTTCTGITRSVTPRGARCATSTSTTTARCSRSRSCAGTTRCCRWSRTPSASRPRPSGNRCRGRTTPDRRGNRPKRRGAAR